MIYGKQNEPPVTASESHMALTGDGRLRQRDRTHRLVQFGREDRKINLQRVTVSQTVLFPKELSV